MSSGKCGVDFEISNSKGSTFVNNFEKLPYNSERSLVGSSLRREFSVCVRFLLRISDRTSVTQVLRFSVPIWEFLGFIRHFVVFTIILTVKTSIPFVTELRRITHVNRCLHLFPSKH